MGKLGEDEVWDTPSCRSLIYTSHLFISTHILIALLPYFGPDYSITSDMIFLSIVLYSREPYNLRLLQLSKAHTVLAHVEGSVYVLQEHVTNDPEPEIGGNDCADAVIRCGADLSEVEERRIDTERSTTESEADSGNRRARDGVISGSNGLRRVITTRNRLVKRLYVLSGTHDESSTSVDDGLYVLDRGLSVYGHRIKCNLPVALEAIVSRVVQRDLS